MQTAGGRYDARSAPHWGRITVFLLVGIVFVGFGNADRVFWKLTSHGAQLPGLVVDVRSYRLPEQTHLTFVPKVAFRDPSGQVRILETRTGSAYYDFEIDQPVRVLWRDNSETIAIDLPFQRRIATSVVLTLFSAIGLVAWCWGIWLIMRRIMQVRTGMRE